MSLPKVLLTRGLPPAGAALLNQHVESKAIRLVQWPHESTADRSWLLTELGKGDIDALICMLGDKVDEEAVAAAGSSLRIVSTMSAGYDHIQLDALRNRNIKLGTTPDALTDATADTGVLLTLMASRRAGEAMRVVLDGKWPSMPWSPLLLCGRGLQGATIGILGFGKIGQLTLKRLLSFSIGRALYTTSRPGSPPAKDYYNLLSSESPIEIRAAESIDELARESDFLITTCALTPETTGVVGRELLSKMKKNAYVVNTARGPVVDSDALVEAVEQGRIAGAGLDVVTGEPNIRADHPLVLNHKIVVLPHIGSATLETRNMMALHAAQNALAGLGVQGIEWAHEVR